MHTDPVVANGCFPSPPRIVENGHFNENNKAAGRNSVATFSSLCQIGLSDHEIISDDIRHFVLARCVEEMVKTPSPRPAKIMKRTLGRTAWQEKLIRRSEKCCQVMQYRRVVRNHSCTSISYKCFPSWLQP